VPTNTNAPATLNDLANRQAQMQAELTELRTDLKAIQSAIDRLAAPENPNLERVDPVPATSNQWEQRLTAVEEELREMRNVQRDLNVALGDIAMRNETGGYDVRLDSIRQAIKGTVPRRGEFIVRNKTRWHQDIVVNGYQYHIRPNESLPLQVQPGTVVSRLPGQQSYTWHIGLPDFKQVIDLEEREPTHVARWVGY
jgi:hypothetical protein